MFSPVRGEKYRSFDRLPSSSARAPTMTPVNGSRGRVDVVGAGCVVEAVARPLSPLSVRFSASVLSSAQQVRRSTAPSGKGLFAGQRLVVLPVDQVEVPLGGEPIAVRESSRES